MTHGFAALQAALADRYVFERELRRGGASTVFLALDRKNQRKVAIKTLSGAAAAGPDEQRFARFLRETTVLSALDHPNILPICDSGVAGDSAYIVSPYLEGETLRQRLDREKQLPFDESLQIAREVADALAYAHERSVVHRDIKPENVLIHERHAMITDFGLAQAMAVGEGGSKLTSSGIVLGTPAYMSPEQVTGEPVDGRTDVYSLGCVLFEMLVGDPPFTGPSPQAVIARHASEKPPSLRLLQSEVPAYVDQAVQTALSKSPGDRFPSASAFGQALSPSSDSPVVARYRSTPSAKLCPTCGSQWPGEQLFCPNDGSALIVAGTGEFPRAARARVRSEHVPTVTAPRGRAPGVLAAGLGAIGLGFNAIVRGARGLKSLVKPLDDRVVLGAGAPEAVRPGEEFTAWFAAYREEFEPTIRQQIEVQSPRTIPRLGLSKMDWASGTAVLVRVAGDHLQVSPQEAEFIWQGDWTTLSFDVRVRSEAPTGVTVLKFDVIVGPLRVARLRVDLNVVTKTRSNAERRTHARPARTAFASYAVDDRAQVLGRISSIATATGLDVFVDCLSLRPGEKWKSRLRREIRKRDLFLLFWSVPAKSSEWVDWEWRTALKLRGLEVIQPHPLCPVNEAPPPPELEKLHFGDAYVLIQRVVAGTHTGLVQ